MSQRIGVAVIAACLVLYIAALGSMAVLMLSLGAPIPVAMGVAVLVILLIGAWALIREIQFGVQAGRLGRRAEAEGTLPEEEVEFTASGRIDRAAAAPLLARYEEEARTDADDWRAQYRLGLVQDAAGARKDARASIRAAIRLERAGQAEKH